MLGCVQSGGLADSSRRSPWGRGVATVEFKGEERAPLPDRDLLEAIVCLANRPGQASGHLLLGVVYNLCTRLLMLNTSV